MRQLHEADGTEATTAASSTSAAADPEAEQDRPAASGPRGGTEALGAGAASTT